MCRRIAVLRNRRLALQAAQSFQIARVAYFSHSSSSPFSQGEIYSKTMA